MLSIAFVFSLLVSLNTAHAQDLLQNPQKIVIDEARNRLLVSNFSGGGSLIQIDADGNQDFFVGGAGCIDGMDIAGNVVYCVGDNRRLFGFDLESGRRVLNIEIPGSSGSYLSSVAADSNGHLYISCPPTSTIYKFRISNSSYEIFANRDGLNRSNGICVEHDNNRLVVIDDSQGSSIIHAINLSNGAVSNLMEADFNFPDGITRDINGTYYVGGFYLPGLYRIDKDFSQAPELFFPGGTMIYPTYDVRDHSLLVTHYGSHRWSRVMLAAGVLAGTVSAPSTVNVEDVEITVGRLSFHPDSEGMVDRRIPTGAYDVTAILRGFHSVRYEDVEFVEDQVMRLDFAMRPTAHSRNGGQSRVRP